MGVLPLEALAHLSYYSLGAGSTKRVAQEGGKRPDIIPQEFKQDGTWRLDYHQLAMSIKKCFWISNWSFKIFGRSRFYWTWNLIVFLFILSLNHLTPFDFQGDGMLVSEFFLSSIKLSAAVISIAFQLQVTLRQKRMGEWDLLLSGPARPLELVGGLAASVMAFQLVSAAALGMAYLAIQKSLGRPVPDYIYKQFGAMLLTLLSLSAFHLAAAIFLRETWALNYMIAGYLLGQLSPQLYHFSQERFRWLLDFLYCMVPDLEPWGYSGGGGGAEGSGKIILYVTIYTILYVITWLILSSIILPKTSGARRA